MSNDITPTEKLLGKFSLLIEEVKKAGNSRELSLTITKLQEAKFWLSEADRFFGVKQ